jgi:glucose-1-phosphate cytidylyltransferase
MDSKAPIKLVILAGGFGTRISEESDQRPKPMIELGGKPILLHIMEHYSRFGIKDFIVCAGYKGYQIKEYFLNYKMHTSDFTINLKDGSIAIQKPSNHDWNITVVDTGFDTMTGGRLKRVADFVGDTFLMTYGDGLSDVNISQEIEFHTKHGCAATVLAVRPPSRFAVLDLDEDGSVSSFREKPQDEMGWINGGFFVLNREVLKLISGDSTVWEIGPLEQLANEGQLKAFKHHGFWQSMDSLRDKRHLEKLISDGLTPWIGPQAKNGIE